MTSDHSVLSILAAYDGSEASQTAIAAAARIAGAASADFAVINVINPLTDLGGVSASSTEEAEQIKTRERQSEIASLLSRLEASATVVVEPLTRGEDVAAHIAKVARDRGATLIVVASRRATGLTGFILGSVAQELLKISPCPVVVVRPD